MHFVTCPKQCREMEAVVLHRVGFLAYSCPKQGQDFKSSAAPQYPNMGQVHPPPPPPGGRHYALASLLALNGVWDFSVRILVYVCVFLVVLVVALCCVLSLFRLNHRLLLVYFLSVNFEFMLIIVPIGNT